MSAVTWQPEPERMCPCGCGKTYAQAVRETMLKSFVNEDQAEAWIDRAAARRAAEEPTDA